MHISELSPRVTFYPTTSLTTDEMMLYSECGSKSHVCSFTVIGYFGLQVTSRIHQPKTPRHFCSTKNIKHGFPSYSCPVILAFCVVTTTPGKRSRPCIPV
ncbi:hypothetical protein TNCV_4929591 [Trichonephila clavipes]|nr:hypothetical protein TNCV_4929591 [Trichonephila clavipes]